MTTTDNPAAIIRALLALAERGRHERADSSG